MVAYQETVPVAAAPQASRKPVQHRSSSNLTVPRTAPKQDNLGSVVSGQLPTMATLAVAKGIDMTAIGRGFKELIGFEISNVGAVLGGLVRATNLDSGSPTIRNTITRLISGKLIVFADAAPEVLGGVLGQWLKESHGNTSAPAPAPAPAATPTGEAKTATVEP